MVSGYRGGGGARERKKITEKLNSVTNSIRLNIDFRKNFFEATIGLKKTINIQRRKGKRFLEICMFKLNNVMGNHLVQKFCKKKDGTKRTES